MYKKRKTGWLEHFDFKILDVVVLLAVFSLTIVRHTQFTMMELVSSVIILVLFEFLFDIVTEYHRGIMYRGVLKEFALSVVNMGVSCGVIVLYLTYIAKQ
ncbi:MAG: hypothetical protein IJT38_05000 [Clostridia bacterium]|nr:hypothetical protein [Clostridia bacterium]